MIVGKGEQRVVSALLAAVVSVGPIVVWGAPASADDAPAATTANVDVGGVITLTGLTPSFVLAGNPGDVVTTDTPVVLTVTTNNQAGYTVTVEPATDTLAATLPGNTDTIPIELLEVRGTVNTIVRAAVSDFTPLGLGAPVEVFDKLGPSSELGDEVRTDYRVTIPFVRPDTYTATLNYIAAAL
jgi:hypothetical protein